MTLLTLSTMADDLTDWCFFEAFGAVEGQRKYDDTDSAPASTTTTPTTTASTAKSTKKAMTVSVSLTQLSKGSTGAEVKTIQRI